MEYYRPLTDDEQARHDARLDSARLGAAFSANPDEPSEPLAVFNELATREKQLVAPNASKYDYGTGTARTANEIHTNACGPAVLLSSEHATSHWTIDHDTGKKTTPKLAEPGTAALGSVIAAMLHGTHIALIGNQTGNANYETDHPYKQHLQNLIGTGEVGAFISLHGMRLGLVSDLTDERPYDMLVGVGNKPSPNTLAAARTVVQVAGELGLRAAVNAPFLIIVRGEDGRYRQQVYSDGTPMINVFAAPDFTTRAAAERSANTIGLNLPALQIELAGSLRVQPRERGKLIDPNPTGPYLAWKALMRAIPRISLQSSQR